MDRGLHAHLSVRSIPGRLLKKPLRAVLKGRGFKPRLRIVKSLSALPAEGRCRAKEKFPNILLAFRGR
jgi:hypothetical protein